jgi:hypothetical protein
MSTEERSWNVSLSISEVTGSRSPYLALAIITVTVVTDSELSEAKAAEAVLRPKYERLITELNKSDKLESRFPYH